MTCEKCKSIAKEQTMIGYYLCRFNSDENTQYLVKKTAKQCDHKQGTQKQEKKDE